MNHQSTLNLDKSAFIALQAELARKKEEVKNLNRNTSNKPTRLDFKNSVKEPPRPKASKPNTEIIEDVEDSVLQYSQNALIAKSKLYDKLRNKEVTVDDPDKFLVDFDAKTNHNKEDSCDSISDHNSDPEDDWVEYTDTLGRSRTCLRKDLPYYQNLNEDLKPKEEEPEEKKLKEADFAKQSEELQLWYEKRDELRQKWEEEEKVLSTKRDIHYQDVLFGEARTHGVGFYSFSHDETERQRQQEELKKMREETEKSQRRNMTIKERRDQQMKQRLEAAKKRKRERLGLPAEAEIEGENTINELEKLEGEKVEEKPEQEDEMSRKVKEYLDNVKRSAHIRPWDVGKAGVQTPVMSQDQWNEKQRSKRKEEFAPPSLYKESTPIEILEPEPTNSGLYFTSKKPRFFKPNEKRTPIEPEYSVEEEEKFEPKPRGEGAEIPPPPSYDKSTKVPRSKQSDLADSIEAGLQFLRNKAEKKASAKPRPDLEL